MKPQPVNDPELQKDIIRAYLSRQTELWLGARAMADRAEGLSANLNTIVANHIRQIDGMLDELIEIPGVRDGA